MQCNPENPDMSDEILQGSREKGGPMNAAVVRASRALPLRRVTPSMMDPNARALRGVKEMKSCAILGKGKKIYVGNLPRDVPPVDLANLVRRACEAEYGTVGHVRVAHAADDRRRRNKSRDPTKLNEGYCFVRFNDESSAERAMRGLGGNEAPAGLAFGGGALRVEWARDTHSEDVDEKLLQQKRDERRKRNEHKARQRKRNKVREVDEIREILQRVPPPGGSGASNLFKELGECKTLVQGAMDRSDPQGETHPALDPETFSIDWSKVPVECDPGAGEWYGSKNEDHVKRRRERKRDQVQSFALVLSHLVAAARRTGTKDLTGPGVPQVRVVDFGSGSGALTLPLAFLFPKVSFHALDMKPKAIELLLEKAEKGGLRNLTASGGMIENFDQEFDIGLALHACGNATDYSMVQAVKNRASFAFCPCCVGKLKFSLEGGSSFSAKHKNYIDLPDQPGESSVLEHPRSEWMRKSVSQNQFALIAKAGDISHGCDQESHGQSHGYDDLARTCKANIEFDRSMYAAENKYTTGLYRLINSGTTAKAEIIVGVPQ